MIHARPTIGVLAGWQFAWTATPFSYLDPIFHGICMAARDLGCNVLLGCGLGSWTGERESLRTAWPLVSAESDFVPVGPWNTDALIAINPLHSKERSRYLQELREAGHPVIFIASGEPGPTIVADNYGGVLEAMAHLVAHGHRSIAFIAGSQDDLDGDSGERLRAYQQAVKLHGLNADPRLLGWGRHLYAGGYAATRALLDSGVYFTAVLASNDESALGVVQALREVGLRIPQDVAVIGFDDRPESVVQQPSLSSVRIPLRKMGYSAVKSLWRYLTGQSREVQSQRIGVRLVPRETCGCSFYAASTQLRSSVSPSSRETLVQAMTNVLQAEVQSLATDELERLCRHLVYSFEAGVVHEDAAMFHRVLEAALARGMAHSDEGQLWQIALSMLQEAIPMLAESWSAPGASEVARQLLDQSRVVISAAIQRRYFEREVYQHGILYRLGMLTARLLTARDEAQVYETLAQELPLLNVTLMWVGLFEAEGETPVAWTRLHPIISQQPLVEQDVLRLRSYDFPPPALVSATQPFSLALFPLTSPEGQLGYVVFDTERLDLYGALVQQLATALNGAALYREAMEGRRLAEQANELKSRFLSTVSHELRTPLNLIVGLSSMVLQESEESEVPLPESYRRDLEQIHVHAQHLGALIGDVLDLASSDAGQLRLNFELVDLSAALRLVIETGRHLAQAKGLAWRVTLPEAGPWVWGDPTRLRQIVLNLINNAIKFTAEGEVHLEVRLEGDTVTVAVHDTGMGIPPAEQTLIFEEFRRAERSITRGYSGLGLGLSICKRLVTLQGGSIAVQSSGEEGAGSTFSFTLPTVSPPRAAMMVPAVMLPAISDSVLVLSHRYGSGTRLLEHLSERGFKAQLVFVDEMPDWLARLGESSPRAIVIDVSTTAQQGWNLLKLLKEHAQTRSVPILFYSVSQESGTVLELDYLTKPVEITDLAQALDQQWLVPEPLGKGRTVLVVDDEPNTLEMHARIVRTHTVSHRVLKARHGREALEILRREPVDLVLLDLMMPEMDGFEVLNAMRAHEATRHVPVIVLTGQVLTESEMAHLNQGVATVLSKGMFSPEETLSHLEAALERHRKLSDEAQRLVRQAMAYIHEHYTEPLSRASLAQHVAYSEDYLTFCFRKELGVTPITYLNRFRIQQAKRLLLETSKSITEIALAVGFSDSSYFSRLFRREVGQSPEAFRQASTLPN